MLFLKGKAIANFSQGFYLSASHVRNRENRSYSKIVLFVVIVIIINIITIICFGDGNDLSWSISLGRMVKLKAAMVWIGRRLLQWARTRRLQIVPLKDLSCSTQNFQPMHHFSFLFLTIRCSNYSYRITVSVQMTNKNWLRVNKVTGPFLTSQFLSISLALNKGFWKLWWVGQETRKLKPTLVGHMNLHFCRPFYCDENT